MTAAAPINDHPEAILTTIIALLSDTRTRNSVALVSRKFRTLERATRTSLTLCGNARDLHLIPTCFSSVSDLNLSLLSPWGHALLSPSASSIDPALLAHGLRLTFPFVYSRSSSTVEIVFSLWPRLRRVKLVRWHQRPQSNLGADFDPLFQQCHALSDLDLSEFYYWTKDLPPVLESHPNVARSLTKLNLLTTSFTKGFRATGGDPNDDGFTSENAQIGRAALVDFFSGLPLLEELVLDVCKNVRDSGLALEVLASKCPRLRALKLR